MFDFLTQDVAALSDQQVLNLRDHALAQHQWARQYSLAMIETIPEALWYVIPPGMTTHVAWQVGHLAVSQYGLMLFRQRGRAEGDIELMPGWLRKQFGRGSTPSTDIDSMPSRGDLLAHLQAIHSRAADEVSQLPAELLREACDIPFCVYPNKLGALMLAPIHEAIHSGHLGALRRGHGLEPVR
jgi:hypothetical protein